MVADIAVIGSRPRRRPLCRLGGSRPLCRLGGSRPLCRLGCSRCPGGAPASLLVRPLARGRCPGGLTARQVGSAERRLDLDAPTVGTGTFLAPDRTRLSRG